MSQQKLLNQERFLNNVMDVDEHVRYAIICDLDGKILQKRKREGVIDFLSEEQNKIALNHTIESWNFRNTLLDKIGKAKYTLQVYEKLRRIIFPYGKEMLLVVTFDNYGGQNDIIERIQSLLAGDYTKPRTKGMQD
jgi:hypothetical protein